MSETELQLAERVRVTDRDRWLATLYAPEAVRPALIVVHALDLELAKVAATTTEPMLGEIRLAWWRERLDGLDRGEVPAQPVLQALAREVLPRGVAGAQLARFEDAWLGVLAGPPDAAGLERHVAARGRALFGVLAALLGSGGGGGGMADEGGGTDTTAALGRAWAAGEAARAGWGIAAVPRPPRMAPALRSLAGLATLGGRDLARAAAGLPPEPRATAARQWLLLRAALTGR